MDGWCVYIMASMNERALYVGATSDLGERIAAHKLGTYPTAYTQKYNIKKLVYYEYHDDKNTAFTREKALKRWRREWKLSLIEEQNPGWDDLSSAFISLEKSPDQVRGRLLKENKNHA